LLLWTGSVVWCVGWALDAASTYRGIRRMGGNVALELNPVARWVMKRVPLSVALGLLFCAELFLVGLHWAVAATPFPFEASTGITAVVASGLVLGGLGHALAAWSNHRGRPVAVLLPVIRFYLWLGRRLRA
jgi:hypothetical protein